MLDCGRYFFIVFMCHLTSEKLLKSVIIERQGIEPPKIHNLFGLIARLGWPFPSRTSPPHQRAGQYERGHPLPRRAAGHRLHVDR